MYDKQQNLQKRLDDLSEEAEIAYRQQGKTLSDIARKRLARQIEDIEKEIAEIEAQLSTRSDPQLAGRINNFGEARSGIPEHLYRQLRTVLLDCGSLATDRGLRSLFVEARLSPWRNRLPEANSLVERTDNLIDFLHNQQNDRGENALVLFLQVLSERFDPGDAYQKRLQELVGLFAQVAAQDLDSPQHPQSWRYKEPTQTATAVFQTLIQEKTAHFSGRQHVFTAVADFINSAPNGYFLIEGEPGIGKSAILARYVQQNDCPAYFNVRALGNNTPHDFLTSLCQQLVVRYNLPYPHLPPDATEDGRFLTRLLNEIAPRLSAQNPLIIAVDALDEVEQNRVAHGENLLYLPPYLPPHVFFLVTQRPLTHSFVTYAPLRPFDLMAYTAENRADVAAFIGRFAQRPRLQRWLTQQASSSDHFIQTLTDKSEDNFMYLRYVLYDIEYGIYRDVNLEQLPAGLLPYYADHWQRMGMQTTPLPHAKLTIIYVLCEAQQPISPTLIANFSSQDGLIVQTVIDEWRQFLHRYPFDSQYQYTLYHHSFRDFLHQKEIIQATGLTLPDINAQIADYLWQTMMNDE